MNNYKKKVLINLVVLIIFVLYFYLLNCIFINFGKEKFIDIHMYISMSVLFCSIIIFEIAYKKDSGKLTIYGIETLILSINTLISLNMINKFHISFSQYINISCIVYLLYYVFKFIIQYTINRREYLKSLSDIKEIVKSEPLKKEAHKRNKWIYDVTRLSKKNMIK